MVERRELKRANDSGGDHEREIADDLVISAARSPEKTIDEWAGAICATWQNAVESIIETGRLLIDAKESLRGQRGAFGEMVKTKLPFGHDTADNLMKIARNPIIRNSEFARNLPPSWSVLYEMTKLPDKELRAEIASGRINCETRRRDVVAIREALAERGIYKAPDLVAAINVIIKFQQYWSDHTTIAEKVWDHVGGEEKPYLTLADVPKAAKWLTDLPTAIAAEDRRMRELWDADDKPKIKGKNPEPADADA